MPPTFNVEAFAFEIDDQIPKHIDQPPTSEIPADPSKYHIQSVGKLDSVGVNMLAINIDDEETAFRLMDAAQRKIDAEWARNIGKGVLNEYQKPYIDLLLPLADREY
jgi:hypothetical protein